MYYVFLPYYLYKKRSFLRVILFCLINLQQNHYFKLNKYKIFNFSLSILAFCFHRFVFVFARYVIL